MLTWRNLSSSVLVPCTRLQGSDGMVKKVRWPQVSPCAPQLPFPEPRRCRGTEAFGGCPGGCWAGAGLGGRSGSDTGSSPGSRCPPWAWSQAWSRGRCVLFLTPLDFLRAGWSGQQACPVPAPEPGQPVAHHTHRCGWVPQLPAWAGRHGPGSCLCLEAQRRAGCAFCPLACRHDTGQDGGSFRRTCCWTGLSPPAGADIRLRPGPALAGVRPGPGGTGKHSGRLFGGWCVGWMNECTGSGGHWPSTLLQEA